MTKYAVAISGPDGSEQVFEGDGVVVGVMNEGKTTIHVNGPWLALVFLATELFTRVCGSVFGPKPEGPGDGG